MYSILTHKSFTKLSLRSRFLHPLILVLILIFFFAFTSTAFGNVDQSFDATLSNDDDTRVSLSVV